MKLKPGDSVRVWWIDAAVYTGEHDPAELHGILAKTEGVLAEIDAHYVKVCHTSYGANGNTDFTIIPRALLSEPPARHSPKVITASVELEPEVKRKIKRKI